MRGGEGGGGLGEEVGLMRWERGAMQMTSGIDLTGEGQRRRHGGKLVFFQKMGKRVVDHRNLFFNEIVRGRRISRLGQPHRRF